MKTQNTFADGINMDVNPLVAPKTVMSNCLNGTLITYNGNENVLQNDMGNGKVADAYLPKGWVPVGVAEYGGIIYVAAYNPEEKLSLLGSFPSPQQTFDNIQEGEERPFNLIPGRYRLFTDKEFQLKPGNRLAVYLNDVENVSEVEPNFNADLSSHKKHWNIDLSLLINNGTLVNVTEYLNNRVPVTNENEFYILNENYFFVNTKADNLSTLLLNNLRVYSGTLTGVPYVEVSENLADSMTVELLPGKQNDHAVFNLNCTIRSSSLLYSEAELGLIGILCRMKANYIDESYFHAGGVICFKEEYLLLIKSRFESLKVSNLLVEYENENLREYSINIKAIIEFNVLLPKEEDVNDKFTIEICPIFNWTREMNLSKFEPLENLTYSQTFEANKIGTGLHQINQWRYYYTNDFITLTWGMESYPSMGENIQDLHILFIDLEGNSIYDELHNHDYYNGEFTDVFDSNIFDTKLPYIARIYWRIGNSTHVDYRWIIPTILYNDFYQNKMVIDFNFDPAQTNLTENLQAMLALKVVGNNVLNFAEEPIEKLESTSELIPFFETTPDIDKVYITNTYTYTLNPRLVSTLENYPFELNYSTPTSINFKYNNNTYLNEISNVLTTEHRVKYILKDVNVTKLFEGSWHNILAETECYVIIKISRYDDTDIISKDDNRIGMFAWHLPLDSTVTPTLEINDLPIATENTNDSVDWNLNDYWNTISNELTHLSDDFDLVIIPIIFENSIYSYINYAVKISNSEWCLYWNMSKYFGPAVDPKRYIYIRNWEYTIDSIVYEAKSVYASGFPYYYVKSTNGSTVNGYLIDNVSNKVEEEVQEFSFIAETNNIELTLRIGNTLYNDFIEEKLTNYFNNLRQRNIKSEELCKKNLRFISPNVKVSHEYTYSNIKPGSYEIWQTINNYNVYGILYMVLERYIPSVEEVMANPFKKFYKYYIPDEELDGNTVYKIEDHKISEFPEASRTKVNSTYYIISADMHTHKSLEISASIGDSRCSMNLGDIPSMNGEAVFGKELIPVEVIHI